MYYLPIMFDKTAVAYPSIQDCISYILLLEMFLCTVLFVSLAHDSDSLIASTALSLHQISTHAENGCCPFGLASLGPVKVVVLGHIGTLIVTL